MTDEIPTTGWDVPDDADESQVPDAEFSDDRMDEPDPAFDDVDEELEDPVPGEGGPEDEPDLGEEPDEVLEADEAIDPEEHDPILPPGEAPIAAE